MDHGRFSKHPASASWQTAASLVLCTLVLALSIWPQLGEAALSADDAQEWRAANEDFDWKQPDGTQVRIVGRGAEDSLGNLYFVGTKTYSDAEGKFIDNSNMFVGRINADDSLGWTKEFGTNETDGANFVTVMNESSAGIVNQYLYVVGWTWGFMDDGAHALNGFGRFGGRDVVLMKLRLEDGRKIWARQFGSTADDMGYGVQRDGGFDTLLLTGVSTTDQVDAVIEMDVDVQNEPRQKPFSLHETQLMDSRARQSSYTLTKYQFGASVKRTGEIVDFAMDGGVTISPRRQRIAENSSLVGEYAVVLNRQPLDNVTVTATIVCLPDPYKSELLVQQLAFVSSTTVERKLEFTRSNWNREQLVRVVAVDDAIAEGVHYSVITHKTTSRDPLYNGETTPFLYGQNVTMQIDDDDVSGIQLSRRHVFVAEGDLNDTYGVVLRSRPWYPVSVSIVPLHPSQAFSTPNILTFEPSTWNVPQVVTVSAVDDEVSENEYGGLHFGGRLLHFSDSKDRRYRTGRPKCHDLPRCDPQDATTCLSEDTEKDAVRVCDITAPYCPGRLGNGACIAELAATTTPQKRFGADPILGVPMPGEDDEDSLSYVALQDLLADQADDIARMTPSTVITEKYPFKTPPPRLRGFVLSFLGLLNIGQARQLHQDFRATLQAICSGLDRLVTHGWATEVWPEGGSGRVLNATLNMFGGSVNERHLWQCGMASFRPSSCGINISIWDNDPGITLSARTLKVTETSDATSSDAVARYSIVLNAPPSAQQSRLQASYCRLPNSDDCGLWGDFKMASSVIYKASTQTPLPNVSIAIVGNSQVSISPAFVTFTSADWFVPQWVTVRAVNDDLAEDGIANMMITHRVQNTTFGYSDARTSFWFRGSSPTMNGIFPRWSNVTEAAQLPYNYLPRVVHSPRHKNINVQVDDNDAAGIVVADNQPFDQIKTRESDDVGDDWVGDIVKSFAFSEMSVTANASLSSTLGGGMALSSVLVFEKDATTFMKFHLPDRHSGDTQPSFSFARLRVYETPFKVINASSDSNSESSSSTAFETLFDLEISIVDNTWSTDAIRNGSMDPATVKFLNGQETVRVSAMLTKQRFVSMDVTQLVQALLPTRLSVVSLKIKVLGSTSPGDTGGVSSAGATQLCSSLFERALRPTLSIGYSFPNRLLGATATQSSTILAASLAVNGNRENSSATHEETEPWWEVTLPELTRLGSVAIFVPQDMSSIDVVESPVTLVLIATLVALDGQAKPLSEAIMFGCPTSCPLVQRLPLRKALTITELNAGVRSLRLYREGVGALKLTQVEAYDPHVMLTSTANGAGLRSRMKVDWNGRLRSNSWRILQSVRQSDDENAARGMRTRQSSTEPAQALSALAVDGQRKGSWDPLVRVGDLNDSVTMAGSTRTKPETDPWWEVDLGAVVPIAGVELFPYVGQSGRGFCGSASDASSKAPSWSGDLVTFSKLDELLQVEDPFQQTFQVALSDSPLSGGGPTTASKTLSFSCAGGVLSIAWTSVFVKARFVTVKRPGTNVTLMLNEVVVTRWNPATTPQFLLIDLRGTGDLPVALSSIQLFAPTDDAAPSSFATPIAYSIHSVSSQRATSGPGSALSLMNVVATDCYVAAQATYREWIVLKLATPSRLGLIDIQSNVDLCGTGVSAVSALSVSARGASLSGLRSPASEAALAATTSAGCTLTALATLMAPASSTNCQVFSCADASCRSTLKTSDDVVFGDFNDIVIFGVPSLVPTTRLPLSQHETRSMLLRDNPVVLASFDTEPRTPVSSTRIASAYQLSTQSSAKALNIDEVLEQTFFSNAVAVQPAMSAFSIELWVRLSAVAPASGTLVTVASPTKTAIADVKWTAQTRQGVFTVRDPGSGGTCETKLPVNNTAFDTVGRWYHVVTSYDPSNARITLSVRFPQSPNSGDVGFASSNATCSLPLLSVRDKILQIGSFASSEGFSGHVANVAWYVEALTNRQLLDHYHDFLNRGTRAPRHNSYALRLSSKPPTSVSVEVNAETACYYFDVCNVTALPRVVHFTPENWNISQNVLVVATDDQLYEGLHHSRIVHNVSSLPTYEVQSFVTTEELVGSDIVKWTQYRGALNVFDRAAVYTAESEDVLVTKQLILDAMHANWSSQGVETTLVARYPYKSSLNVRDVQIEIEDATVPGIQFSTSSLIVSENGKGNDYQILLLSEPTSDVRVVLNTQSDCYRECFSTPLCASQATTGDLSCGGSSAGTKLCNITVTPDVLLFTPTNWSFPQTVRVLAVDDMLDEADVHLSTIKATSQSLDPIYDGLFLPDIVVAVEDNDDSTIDYSTLAVAMKEKDPTGVNYALTLLTEPWANVTIAMSNEADGTCYRRCGYPFDEKDCGLPRQQTVTSVRLASKSPREIHEISLRLPRPRVMEVQRIATYSDHVDHIYSIQVTGGFAPEVQVVEFAFNNVFKKRFASAAAITAAGTYLKSFKIGVTGKATVTASLDGFASAEQLQAAINGLVLGRASNDSVVRVSRELRYDEESLLRWRITFLRFVSEDLTFPQLTVVADSPFEGTLTAKRVAARAAPSGTLKLQYGKNALTSVAAFSLLAAKSDIEGQLRDISTVYAALSSRRIVTSPTYGFIFTITFTSVDTYQKLTATNASLVAADNSISPQIVVAVTELQSPVQIGGHFVVRYDSPYVNRSVNATVRPRQTNALPWNASQELMASELASLHGLGNVSVSRRQLTPEGGMDWTIGFISNNGNLTTLQTTSLNLTGKGVGIQTSTVVDGVSLGGTFQVEMGGPITKTHPVSQRVYTVVLDKVNATNLRFNISARALADKLASLNVTERANVTRVGIDCDVFDVCEGYIWTISYINSAGNLPPIQVYGNNDTIRGSGAVIAAKTVANGTYLGGFFSLGLELFDPETNITHRGKTWNLPMNVTAPGMDQAIEAIRFVRSNREAEYDPETRLSRGMKFDKGVRVFREGPYLDGGYMWRLEWAIEDYVRFQDLKITIDTSLVTQQIEPLVVASERDLLGTPRCSAIPMARFQADKTDPFGLRGFCVYDLANVTIQERYLCNYTVENPWVVFSPHDWCKPQQVQLTPVDDFIDETTVQNGNITFSNVTHTVFSDDLIYSALPLKRIVVSVENDDVAKVLVSESHLDVSEDGSVVAYYELVLTTEPLYDVKIVVLPWLDNADTKCYRFGLCNVTLEVDTYIFTPRQWNVPQRVVVKATDDNLDEFDRHDTGISHVSYSDDLKYHQRTDIPKIHVTVTDNDDSAFTLNKLVVNVTEGGNNDTYQVVLGSEPFAKVTIAIQNVGTKGNFAATVPSSLVFTWLNWNQPQTVQVVAVDDDTQDPADSSSVMVHSITSNDFIYANLKNLASVKVWIRDNDVSGINVSTSAMAVVERAQPYSYQLRLTSEPWFPVVVNPNASHNCYVRAATQERVCNASMVTTALYFGAGNWSQWQTVEFVAFDDSLEETPIHSAKITHASSSKDPLYVTGDYVDKRIALSITDNDFSFVNISLASTNATTRSRLHVAEGGFNDSYTVVLNSEPYENVVLTVSPRVERIVSIDLAFPPTDAAQVGTAFGSRLSSVLSGSMLLVFTPQDWSTPRIVTVFGIDDEIPEDPTQFSAITHRVESADAKYNISNSTIGVGDVPVIISDREAIPPPLPVSSLFDSTGTRVLITFDSAVYHAATMLVRSGSFNGSSYSLQSPTFNCSSVFSSSLTPLGKGPACGWRSDLKQLIITLGTGATVLPGNALSLYECTTFVNQICQSPNVLRARHTSRAYTQAAITLRVDPATVAKPKIVLTVPDQVGSCGTWRADASLSTGSVGRAFKDQWWFVLPRAAVAATSVTSDVWLDTSRSLYSSLAALCVKYEKVATLDRTDLTSQLSAFISTTEQLRSLCYVRSVAAVASATAATQVQLNSSLLQVDTTYVVGLTLVNAFSQQATAVQTVQVGQLPSPVVFAVGESTLQVSRGGSTQPLLLQADATLTCPLLTGTELSFRWFATVTDIGGGSAPVTVDLNATNSAKDPRVFRVSRSQLSAGKTYRFRVEASIPNAASSSAFFTVNVVSSPLVAVVQGGNRSIGEKDALVLNGSLSVDPDLEADPFVYSWRCEDWTNETMAAIAIVPCANVSSPVLDPIALPTASSQPTITLDPFTLVPERVFRFFLTVSKTPTGGSKAIRNTTTQTNVWTTAGSVPEVSIQASVTKLNPTTRLTLNAVVKSTYPYTARWVEDEGDLLLPNEGSNITDHDAFTMPLTSPSNGIRRNRLTAGRSYTLRLVAVDINGNRGFGVVSFEVNAPPSPGTFQVSPRDGYAMTDAFTLECLQWTDDAEDLPLRYSFGVLPTATFESLSLNTSLIRQRMLPLVSDQLLPSATATMLPPEDQEDSVEMTVVAFITDSMGGTAVAFDSITVRMPEQAKTSPVAFASTFVSSQNTSNAASQTASLLSAALIVQRAMNGGTSDTACPGMGSTDGVCSGHGTCDLKTLVCACEADYMGPSCQLLVAEVRALSNSILASLGSSTLQSVEPSSSGLSQQARVVDSVTQSSSRALASDGLGQVTALTSTIAQNAFALQDSDGFVDSTGATMLSSLSTVLTVAGTRSGAAASADSMVAPASRRNRRRLAGEPSTAVPATTGSCADESASAKGSFGQLIATLQSLAAVASQDLLPGETPARLSSGQITTTSGAGSRLAVDSSSFSVNLTRAAVACLGTRSSADLFLNVFQLSAVAHPICSLKDATAISSATVVTVHDKSALTAAFAGKTNGAVATLALTGDNFCVAQAVANEAAEGKSTSRRLATGSVWRPLVALSLPHTRSLTAVEQRNFTTGCRSWNAELGVWERDVCFKDDTQSTMDVTVCYCAEIRPAPGLEVLVTLEERLDFYAQTRDLYRDDEPSVVGPISMAVLLALIVVGGKYGMHLDRVDDKREKEKTITNLNRAKWSELKERTQAAASGVEPFEDFATFMAKREQQKKAQDEASAITAATSESQLVTAAHVASMPVEELTRIAEDSSTNIPNETRVLFGSSGRLEGQYTALTWLLRGANLVLIVVGVIAAFVGVDFYLALGNSTASELVMLLYGKSIGLVLLICGGVLAVLGLWGFFVAKDHSESSVQIARSAYASLLLLSLVGQLFFVFLAFRYVNDLEELPLSGFDALRAAWEALSAQRQDEIQTAYGCCGFSQITETTRGCPEEALDASPPRTCVKVIEAHAQTLFETSFVFLEIVFLVQVVALLLIQTIRTWRRLRLAHLIDSTTFAPSSVVDVVLFCSFPSVLRCLLGLVALIVFMGVDLLAQLHVLSNALFAGILGVEVGAVHIAFGAGYALVLLQGLLAIHRRDSTGIQSFAALGTACLLLTVALGVFVARFHDHWLLDPSVVDFVHTKYLQLARGTLVDVEIALECCGFTSHAEGACVASAALTVPTCRNTVLSVLHRELHLVGHRVVVFTVIQAAVLVVAIAASIRMKRSYGAIAQIQPLGAATPPPPPVVTTLTHALVYHSSLLTLSVGSSAAFVLGLLVVGAGLDAMYRLNVLHLSLLLRVFDHHVVVYLLAAGGSISLFGLLGVSVAWMAPHHRHHRRLAALFVCVSAVVFVATFALTGFTHRYAHISMSDDALDERVEAFWIATPPTTTRVFLQNVFTCCGYDKVERVNGSVVFTDAGELSAWHLSSDAVDASAYTTTPEPVTTQPQHRRLSVKLTSPRRLTHVVCPDQATEPCAPRLKQYVRRVASRTFQLSVALLASVCAMAGAVGGLVWRPETASVSVPAARSWDAALARALLLVLSGASLFVALASFFLGLDIVTHWSLFSSTALQLVFPRSIGVAFFVYAAYIAFVNAYAMQGVVQVVVHRVFLQSLARVVLILGGLLCVALTAYASHYGGDAWTSHLGSSLSRQWDTLSPLAQHRISLEFECCGFDDPAVVQGRGIVFDRPAAGYACSLAAARGCRHVMETQIGASLAWVFVLVLTLTLVETLALVCSLRVLSQLRRLKPHDWFVIESRVRFAAGKYRSEVRRSHVLLSLASRFDRKLTRAQRLTSVACGLLTSLAVYAAWFAHHGCHRRALKTCRQPDAWAFLGMGLLYGGLVGFSAQMAARALFESVRNRSDDETSEVAATRQRKEKALLFRGLFGRRDRAFSDLKDASVATAAHGSSLLDTPVHATTEERWYAWLLRFTNSLYGVVGALLFLFGCGLATYMALVLVGVNDSLFGVKFDQGPREALIAGVLLAATALLAWYAIDVKQRTGVGASAGSGRNIALFVAVAIAAVLLLAGLCLGMFMASQTLDEDSTNWTIRNTNFSVPERLRTAWTADATGFFRQRVQEQLQCCGFRDAADAAVRPCPGATVVAVQYEAVRVDGRVVVESKDEVRDREGCYAAMLAEFHAVLARVAYIMAAAGVALLLLAASALFLAHDVAISKDTKLKLRVTTTASSAARANEVRQTFEKVVGLKIAAPARGKIFSKLLSNSLENVAPHVVRELASESLAGTTASPLTPPSSSATTVTLPNGQVVSSSLTVNRWDAATAMKKLKTDSVPYPAWIARVVFAVCGVWLAAMGYIVVANTLELGVTTAWRCVAAWAVGACFHLLLVEPLVVFVRIVLSTLSQWWETTLLARVVRYGRAALRIRPSADEQAAKYYASLSLYERIRYNAAVRIQRRLATRLARRRFLQSVRERREQSHRLLVAQRRLVLKQAIEGFTAEEIQAFRLLFEDADTARLGLVSYQFISQSIYQLGVRVDAALVREFLMELDPAYADLVDFEHFLYGMHRVRVHHQEEQTSREAVAAEVAAADERAAAALLAKEEFVSSSSRFGPGADPQARVLVKRQNLMRELREKRESLSYRLMSKVNKLPPLLQRGRSASGAQTQSAARGAEHEGDAASELSVVEAAATDDAAVPTGAYVLLQNRKLSPKKRALEMVLKKKSREDKDKARGEGSTAGSPTTRSPRKMMPTLRFPGSPRARSQQKAGAAEEVSDALPPPPPGTPPVDIHPIDEGDETEPPSPQKAATASADDEEAKPFGTFMLLSKQTASAGKHKVMEKILQKMSEPPGAATADEDADSDDESAGGGQARGKEAALSGAEATTEHAAARPTTAERRERAQGVAKSSLEKALKKKAAGSAKPR